MKKARIWLLFAGLIAALSLVAAGCGGDDEEAADTGAAATTGAPAELDKVSLQLKWVTQAQFAGYYAALEEGYYEDEGLDVELKPGGPDITPEQVVASGQAEFGIDWLPALLAARDQGGDLVNIAQVFARSGMTELTWKDSGITDVAGMKGKKVGVWCCGNENELYAALVKNNIDPKSKDDVTIVNQPFDMNLFLNNDVDAAAAMTYNELAQVLETKNPETGELYTLDDLNVISMEDAGTAMLEDGIFVQGSWIADEANQDIAQRFLKASFKGWVFCRDHQDECLQYVLDSGPTLGEGHQRLAAERDQRADVAERDRDRRDGRGRLPADGRHCEAVRRDQAARVQRLLPHRPRRGGREGARGRGRGRERCRLEEGDRRSHCRRGVGTDTEEGDPQCPF